MQSNKINPKRNGWYTAVNKQKQDKSFFNQNKANLETQMQYNSKLNKKENK